MGTSEPFLRACFEIGGPRFGASVFLSTAATTKRGLPGGARSKLISKHTLNRSFPLKTCSDDSKVEFEARLNSFQRRQTWERVDSKPILHARPVISTPESSLTGKWGKDGSDDKAVFIEFFSDNTMTFHTPEAPIAGKWTVLSDGRIKPTFPRFASQAVGSEL